MSGNGAAVVGMGMVTSVGLNARQSAASVRAGITRFAETSVYNKRFEPFRMAILPDDVLPPLAPELEGTMGLTARQGRMLRLAAPALEEAVKGFPDIGPVPLFLGAPEQVTGRPKPVGDNFLEELSTQSGVKFNVAESKAFCEGRAAGLIALKEGIAYLTSGRSESVLVGGVDTFLDLYLLGTLDMEGRILGAAVMDGFIPGEGAAFLLLTAHDKVGLLNLEPLAQLSPVSTGFEEGHLYSDQPYQGEGLAATFKDFFATSGINKPIREVYSSMNGENHWGKEWGVAFLRNSTAFDPTHGMHHPADCLGDTGAASGIIMAVLAIIGVTRGYRRSPALVTCSSDYGSRAVVAVSAPR